MKKNSTTIQLTNISHFIVLKVLHWATLLYYVCFFSYETLFSKNTDLIYAIALSAIVPNILIQKIKSSKKIVGNSNCLPYLSERFAFNESKFHFYNICSVVDSILLIILQIRNFLYPYEYFWVQYSPAVFLFGRIMSSLIITYLIRSILHHHLMNNTL